MPDLKAGRDRTTRHSVQRCSLVPQSHSPDDPDRKDIAAKSRERFKTPAVSQGIFHQILLLISPYQQNQCCAPDLRITFTKTGLPAPSALSMSRWDGFRGRSTRTCSAVIRLKASHFTQPR